MAQQKSLFQNLFQSYQTAYLGNDIKTFNSNVKTFVDQASDKEKRRIFKINPDSVSKVFMTECRNEDHFYEKLQRVNEQRYVVPFLKHLSLEIKKDEYLGIILREVLRRKRTERIWREVYRITKDYSDIQIARLARQATLGTSATEDRKEDIISILGAFQKKHQLSA